LLGAEVGVHSIIVLYRGIRSLPTGEFNHKNGSNVDIEVDGALHPYFSYIMKPKKLSKVYKLFLTKKGEIIDS